MSSRAKHFKEAEKLLDRVANQRQSGLANTPLRLEGIASLLAEAQVHATLANAQGDPED